MRLIWLFLLFPFALFSQTKINVKTFDFGDISTNSPRYADMVLTNPTTKDAYILRVEHSPDVIYKTNVDVIKPNQTLIIRFQVNPKKKGDFNYVLRVYISDLEQPFEVRLKGNLLDEINYSDFKTKCPDFNAVPPNSQEVPELTIIVVDKETREPLSKSTVSIIRNGKPAGAWKTGRQGSFKAQVKSGLFYFYASHDGYFPKEAGVFVGPEIREITIPLIKDSTLKEELIVETPTEEAIEIPIEEVEETIASQIPPPAIDSVTKVQLPELASLDPMNFDQSYFADVNAIFVLDISSSMTMGNRMELLKYSLNSLVGHLRNSDRIGIVTYSDKAQVFLGPTLASSKSDIEQAVDDLKPHGLTAGGRGIKLGYKEVMKNYDPNKANMVIIITDGAFNKDSDDYQKIVRKYSKKGVTFSVVGVEARPKDAELMTAAATYGKGRYVDIKELSDAQHKLFQEIRLSSFKKK
ncbi:MAG: VWA domain-containing protein [Fluviicola sp.]